MKTHRDEMIRFANSEEGTAVWFKHATMTEWKRNYIPTWSKDTIYIVDDKYAELRKENIDTGRPIQVLNVEGEWVTQVVDLHFILSLSDYRLEPKEHGKDGMKMGL